MAQDSIRLGGLYDKGLIAEVNESGFIVGRLIMDKAYEEGEELRIVIFVNNYKEQDTHPDLTVLKARPREEEAPKKAAGGWKKKAPAPAQKAPATSAPKKFNSAGKKPSAFGKKK